MKKILQWNTILLVSFLISVTSCDKWIDTEMNINPDVPSNVPMKLLLPTMEVSMAYQIGGIRAVKTTNIYMQFLNGVARQSNGEAKYILSATDTDDFWRRMYYQPMMDAVTLIRKAKEQNSPHYAGVAKVCLALCLGTMTNLFGNMPYTEAFKGNEAVLQPVYDTQESIYNTIDDLLKQAIDDLGSTSNTIALAGDLIYSNNKASWIKAANAVRARYALNRKDYANALTYANNSFVATDKFVVTFGTSNAEAGPMYQYATVSSYKNDVKMCKTFIDKLNAVSDPRRTYYAKYLTGTTIVGSPAGSEDASASGLGTYNNSANAPVVLSSYAEMQFIKAECYLKIASPDLNAAVTAYKNGAAASVLAVTGSANTTWLDANINTITTAAISLQKIIEQKYIAMYSTVVPYDDFRRTGFPAMTPVTGAGPIPARFPYPQTEISYNSNCPVITDSNQKLWIFN